MNSNIKSLIKVSSLTRTYSLGGEIVKALDNVSFEVEAGEMIAIVGTSGSGKSTLMHILGGLDKATSGQVFISGKDISKFKPAELSRFRNESIGFVFQNFNLQPMLSATENVLLPLLFSKNLSQRKKLAVDALVKLGLKDRLNHKPSELSGGQRQRVSIARAIVNSPKIILADEPTGNLDSKTGQSVLEILRELNQNDGVTVIVVTHDPNIAKSCDRIIQMKDGHIIDELKTI